jgi:hypothetical protein
MITITSVSWVCGYTCTRAWRRLLKLYYPQLHRVGPYGPPIIELWANPDWFRLLVITNETNRRWRFLLWALSTGIRGYPEWLPELLPHMKRTIDNSESVVQKVAPGEWVFCGMASGYGAAIRKFCRGEDGNTFLEDVWLIDPETMELKNGDIDIRSSFGKHFVDYVLGWRQVPPY